MDGLKLNKNVSFRQVCVIVIGRSEVTRDQRAVSAPLPCSSR